MRKAITSLIAIVTLLALTVAVGAMTLSFFNSQLGNQQKQVEKKNVFNGVIAPIKIIISTPEVSAYTKDIEVKVNLSLYKDIF